MEKMQESKSLPDKKKTRLVSDQAGHPETDPPVQL